LRGTNRQAHNRRDAAPNPAPHRLRGFVGAGAQKKKVKEEMKSKEKK